jgi:polysaccharide export outer membrane protein
VEGKTLKKNENSKALLAAVLAGAMAGCTIPGQKIDRSRYDVVDSGPPAADYDVTQILPQVLTSIADTRVGAPQANAELTQQLRSYTYRIGPQDVLSFTVWDHPELTIPAGEFRDADVQGHLVGPDGRMFFPYVGSVDVAGRTLAEIRDDVSRRLGRFVQNPQLDVRVAAFRSKKVNVSGEVLQPGVLPVTDVPLTLIEAVALAGGATANAALQRVQVARDGALLTFDMLALLERGDMRQNLLLQDGDVVYVPESSFYAVHMLGEVATPGTVPMVRGRLNLAEAIAAGGGFNPASANAERVFVFRGSYARPEVFWLDAKSADAMLLATQFPMQPQDVVFVAATGLVRWDRLVSLILPSVQTLWQTQSLIDDLENDDDE